MEHTLEVNGMHIAGNGTAIINDTPMQCPINHVLYDFPSTAIFTPKSLPFYINGPHPLKVNFPHIKNEYSTLDDVYILSGQFESHRFQNKELFLPVSKNPSTPDDILFHGYTVQSFLTFVHSLSDKAFYLCLVPRNKEIQQGLISGSNIIYLSWPDTVESLTSFLMGLCWHIAGQSFGYLIRPPVAHPDPIEYQLQHLWVIVGCRGYLYLKLLKQVFGPSFVQFYTHQTIQYLLKTESTNIPPIASFFTTVRHKYIENSLQYANLIHFFISKTTVVFNGLSRCIGEQHMDNIIQSILKQANSNINTITISEFFSKCKKHSSFHSQHYLKQYLYQTHLPHLIINYQYNKRKSCLEIDIEQKSLFTGPLAIKIQEPDGSFEHVLDVQKQQQSFEVRYHTRYKRIKRFRNTDTEDVMFHRDINGIVVSEYPKPEEEQMEYIQVDCDHLWIGHIEFKQSEYMTAQMVLKELDVATQCTGMELLANSTEPSAATTLFRILCNHRHHPFIRQQAAICLQNHHVLGIYYLLQYLKRFWCEHDNVDPFHSPHHLLQYPLFVHQQDIGIKLELQVKQPQLYKYLYFTPLVLKKNEFDPIGQYHVATAAIEALASIRIAQDEITLPSIRESLGHFNMSTLVDTATTGLNAIQQYHVQMNQQTMQRISIPNNQPAIAPLLIRKIILDILKCQDNTGNQYDNDEYTSILINALHHAFMPIVFKPLESTGEVIGTEEDVFDISQLYRTNGMDKMLYGKAVHQVEVLRLNGGTKTIIGCLEFIGHGMMLDFIDLDLQRILPYTQHSHELVKLKAFELVLLLGGLQYPTFIQYLFHCMDDGLLEMLNQYIHITSISKDVADQLVLLLNKRSDLICSTMIQHLLKQTITVKVKSEMVQRISKSKGKEREFAFLLSIAQMYKKPPAVTTIVELVTWYVQELQEDKSILPNMMKVMRRIFKNTTDLIPWQKIEINDVEWLTTASEQDILAKYQSVPVVVVPDVQEVDNSVNTVLLSIWTTLNSHPRSAAFRYPIDPVALGLPTYSDIIKHPMDLSTIKDNLSDVKEFSDKVMLMLQNCVTFNNNQTQVYHDALQLFDVFKMEFSKFYPNIPIVELAVQKPEYKVYTCDYPSITSMDGPWDVLVADRPVKAFLNNLKTLDESRPFLMPVDPVAMGIPHYADVIKEPMDLSLIFKRLNANYYVIIKDLVVDLERMLMNCFIFNPPQHPIHIAGTALRTIILNGLRGLTPLEDFKQHCIGLIEQQVLHKFLMKIKAKKNAFPFLEPVDTVKLNIPQYKTIIKEPMDLGTLELKLNHYKLESIQAFFDKLYLIFENCFTFNKPDHSVHIMGKQMMSYCKKEEVGVLEQLTKKTDKLKMMPWTLGNAVERKLKIAMAFETLFEGREGLIDVMKEDKDFIKHIKWLDGEINQIAFKQDKKKKKK